MNFSTFLPMDVAQKLSHSDWRYRMVFEANPQTEEGRGCIERLLLFAEKQGVLDVEMLSRLGSKSYEQFSSAIHELAVAEFLSPIGDINWHPPGRNLRIGEFEIAPPKHEPIFIEVKSLFASEDERREDRNWNIVRPVAHSISSPFRMNVEFLKLPNDIIPAHFRPWLQRQISTLRKELTLLHQKRELIFSDPSEDGSVTEVKVEFIKWLDKDLPTTCDLDCGLVLVDLSERVKNTIDGALAQLPDNQPTLVVIADAVQLGLDEFQMLTAMFSFPKVTFHHGSQEGSIHYSLQGIVQESIRTRLSGVGVWHHKWTTEPKGSLDVYHNPLGAKGISPSILDLPRVCQLVPKGTGKMEWMPIRPAL